MFDIGFFELSLIGVVALVVIGPERLPSVARTAGKWIGKANRFVSNIKEDISKEIKDEDLKKILDQQKELANEFKQAAEKTGSAINQMNPSESLDGILDFDESSSKKAKKKKKKKKKKKLEAAAAASDNNSNSPTTSTESTEAISSDTILPQEVKSSDLNIETASENINSEIDIETDNNQLNTSEAIEKND